MRLSFLPGLLIACSLFAFVIGIGLFTFVYARGDSYLTDNPAACANCHIMNDQYRLWQASAHHNVAACNTCHAPATFVGRYSTKALNGFLHSYAFTTGRFPDPIQINERNRRIAENACRNCHEPMTSNIGHDRGLSCLHCHKDMGH